MFMVVNERKDVRKILTPCYIRARGGWYEMIEMIEDLLDLFQVMKATW